MTSQFQLARGSIPGAGHIRSGKDNQDAHHAICTPSFTVALVCDGCSDGAFSGVGAQFACRLIAKSVADLITHSSTSAVQMDSFWERVRSDVLAQVRVLAISMGGSFSQAINEYFLFTVVGVVITAEKTVFFSIGDGIIIVNGELYQLGPFPRNAPPYMAYGLSPDRMQYEEQALRFRLLTMDTEQVEDLMIGTDGCLELIHGAERLINGRQEQVGPIDQFWSAAFAGNPSLVTRRLRIINSSAIDWESRRVLPGWLQDDVTLITARRRESDA